MTDQAYESYIVCMYVQTQNESHRSQLCTVFRRQNCNLYNYICNVKWGVWTTFPRLFQRTQFFGVSNARKLKMLGARMRWCNLFHLLTPAWCFGRAFRICWSDFQSFVACSCRFELPHRFQRWHGSLLKLWCCHVHPCSESHSVFILAPGIRAMSHIMISNSPSDMCSMCSRINQQQIPPSCLVGRSLLRFVSAMFEDLETHLVVEEKHSPCTCHLAYNLGRSLSGKTGCEPTVAVRWSWSCLQKKVGGFGRLATMPARDWVSSQSYNWCI